MAVIDQLVENKKRDRLWVGDRRGCAWVRLVLGWVIGWWVCSSKVVLGWVIGGCSDGGW